MEDRWGGTHPREAAGIDFVLLLVHGRVKLQVVFVDRDAVTVRHAQHFMPGEAIDVIVRVDAGQACRHAQPQNHARK